jgi:hypothetical protein
MTTNESTEIEPEKLTQRWAVKTASGRDLRIYGGNIEAKIAPDVVLEITDAGWWSSTRGLLRDDWDGTLVEDRQTSGRVRS